MQINKITAIARPFDPSYPTNLAIAVCAMLVGAGGTAYQLITGVELTQSVLWGVAAGFTILLAWALARELDPDHDLSAFAAAGLALVGVAFLGIPSITPLLWILLLVRVLNRTAGLPARISDFLLILALAGWLSLREGWIYGMMTTLAFFLDSQLSSPNRRHLAVVAAALLVTLISFRYNTGIPGAEKLSLAAIFAVWAISVLFIPVIIASRKLESVGDQTGKALSPIRVQTAQVMALWTGIQLALDNGAPGLASLMPLWAAMLGASLYGLWEVIRVNQNSYR